MKSMEAYFSNSITQTDPAKYIKHNDVKLNCSFDKHQSCELHWYVNKNTFLANSYMGRTGASDHSFFVILVIRIIRLDTRYCFTSRLFL